MPSAFDRVEFAPPAQPGMLRAMALAVLAHLLLVAALTWGVNWKRQSPTELGAEAELWASVPQQAAPRAVDPPPPPPAPTPPEVKPEPQPVPKAEPKPPTVEKAPDIVDKVDKPPKKVVEEKPVDKPEPKAKPTKPEPKPEVKPEPKPDAAAAKREAQRKAAEDAAAEEKQVTAQREENLKRITGMAGATGGPSATGNAQQSSGPSSGYGGRVKARVKPNLVFTDTVSGNPLVSIEVRAAPDGTILGRPRIVKSSGNREWDEAVIRAFEKTEVMPRDMNGTVPSPIIVDWRVND
jgi:colicin import membrane protein